MHQSIFHTHLYPEEVILMKKINKSAKVKSHKGHVKFNLQKNADGEPMDGYLLCLFLPGKIYKWGREPAQGIDIGEFALD